MAVLVFALESWIFSILGLAWLSIRSVFGTKALIEEYLIYSQLALSTLHLALSSLSTVHQPTSSAYFSINLIHWIMGVLVSADSFGSFTPSSNKYNVSTYINTSHIQCCPNQDIAAWNLQIYFSGLSIYLAPMAITMAFQTLYLILSSAALLNTQITLWPGSYIGYFMLHFTSSHLLIKFFSFSTTPCPPIQVSFFGGWITVDFFWFLAAFALAFLVLGAVEGNLISKSPKIVWNILGLVVAGLFGLTCYLNLNSTNILTYPWISWNGLAVACVIYSFFENTDPSSNVWETYTVVNSEPPPSHTHPPIPKEKHTKRTRFVVPPSAKLYPAPKSSKQE